ncbi:hypothetical protein C8D82_1205 [Victivallis vadensis]|uniref:Uncharacterized protein n=1 Tax=Victivallis vadensis TaxID=172901 RepID=A0A2U1ASX0_9BACT|nr:hypothetical protein C8D82_1205 [Victivallis vadensis]
MPFWIARAGRYHRQVRTPMPLRGAYGGKVPLPGARSTPSGVARRLTLAKHWLVCITTYAAHNKRGQRRERM